MILDEKNLVKKILRIDYDDDRIRARIEITEGQGYRVSVTNKREEEKLDIIWKVYVDFYVISDFIAEFADNPYKSIEEIINYVSYQFILAALR